MVRRHLHCKRTQAMAVGCGCEQHGAAMHSGKITAAVLQWHSSRHVASRALHAAGQSTCHIQERRHQRGSMRAQNMRFA